MGSPDTDVHDPHLPRDRFDGRTSLARHRCGAVHGCVWNPEMVLARISARREFRLTASGISGGRACGDRGWAGMVERRPAGCAWNSAGLAAVLANGSPPRP